MTRKEEIEKASKNRADQYSHAVEWNECYHHFMEGAEWADSHSVNQWRKAECELPKRIGNDSETVIITDGYFIHLGHYSFIYNSWVTEENYMYKNESIAYWHPIPELPKD